ncbi:hypothetical protein CL1_0136 [Thermococcus cleftensis]|uniref:Uncharacterized protein n=1 Tax=Thermococcus cleftensis (strain DSM 27260 / KACC 17922 / CL1) TaxID=163003 RepID=I3ZRL7_THECF|nr:hypothetical protein [Thermococcus cleftensis]AFL94351.1 hypothetical protein CL1_0136 [Thermococcus cleftensis]
MRWIPILVLIAILLAPCAKAATVAVDVSHGEGTVALVNPVVDPASGRVIGEGIVPTLSWYEWAYFGRYQDLESAGAKFLGDRITYESLRDVDVLIIGQLHEPLDDDEIKAVVKWFSLGGKVLWVSGDSDIDDGSYVQDNANKLLSAIPGVRLRIDYATVTDTFSNAGKSSYVSGFVRPDLHTPGASVLNEGYIGEVGKVLFHEGGVIAWVDDSGKWHPLIIGEIPEGVYRIVTTSSNGMIEDNRAPEPRAYGVWEKGIFTLLAVEFVKLPNGAEGILIVSGESPYGSQVPIWVNRYGNYLFDGQRFVSNLLNWAVRQSYTLEKAETLSTTTTSTTRRTTTTTSENEDTTTSSSWTADSATSSSTHQAPTTSPEESSGSGWLVAVLAILLLSAAVLAFLLVKKR